MKGSLSQAEIDRLLALPVSQRGRKKAGPDFSDPAQRTQENWFKLMHHLFDEDSGDPAYCSNKNCTDPRDKTHGQTVVEVNGALMCRYCYYAGYQLTNANQESLI